MKTAFLIFFILLILGLEAKAVAPYGIKGQNQSTLYSNVHQFPNNQVTNLGGINALVETGNHNLLTNPSFEHSSPATGWTLSGCTSSTETTIVNHGKQSLKISCAAQTLKIYQDSTLYATHLAGQNSQRSIQVYSTVAGVSVCSGSATVASTTNCIAVSDLNKFGLYEAPEPIGTSNGLYIVSSGAITGDIYLDDAKIDTGSIKGNAPAITDLLTFARGALVENTNEIEFTVAAITTTNRGIISIIDDTANTRTKFTALRKCIVDVSTSGTGTLNGQHLGLYKNGVLVTAGNETSLSGYRTITSISLSLNVGDFISIYTPSAAAGMEFSVKAVESVNLETYSSQCGANCVDAYSALVSSTGVVSQENVDWLNGNFSKAGGTSFFLGTLNTTVRNTLPLNCKVSPYGNASANAVINATTATTIEIRTITAENGVLTDYGFQISCSKQGVDLIASRMITGIFVGPRSELRVTGGSGHGSTNTAIRRFTTTISSTGSDITNSGDSATLGHSFTINTSGVYSMTYCDSNTATGHAFGFTKNSNQLTTGIQGIDSTSVVIYAFSLNASTSVSTCVSGTAILAAGDVIRAHTEATHNGTSASTVQFRITKVGN